jgi:queuosine precursor transporter
VAFIKEKEMDYVKEYKYTIGYIVLIVLVNIGFTIVPLVPLFGEMFPPMSLVVGLIFVARDYAQREIGHRVIVAMLFAGFLSWAMADPYVALASVVAFFISELIDWLVYSWSWQPFHQRVLISSVAATPVDSSVFLYMIGHFSYLNVILMTIAKMAGALVVWWMIKKR